MVLSSAAVSFRRGSSARILKDWPNLTNPLAGFKQFSPNNLEKRKLATRKLLIGGNYRRESIDLNAEFPGCDAFRRPVTPCEENSIGSRV